MNRRHKENRVQLNATCVKYDFLEAYEGVLYPAMEASICVIMLMMKMYVLCTLISEFLNFEECDTEKY